MGIKICPPKSKISLLFIYKCKSQIQFLPTKHKICNLTISYSLININLMWVSILTCTWQWLNENDQSWGSISLSRANERCCAKEGIKELKTFPLLIAAPFAPTPIDFASPYIYIIFSNKTKKILKNTYRYTTMIEDFLCQCTHVYPLHPVQEILLILWQVSFFCYYHVFIRIRLVKLQRS